MKYSVIAIEREYASGGRDIGKRVAQLLGMPYYGSEVLQMAARQIGASPDYVQEHDEVAPNPIFYSFVLMARASTYGIGETGQESALQGQESRIIMGLADKGNCVIIGRRAGAVLKGRPGVLRVFIYSDIAARRKRAVEVYGQDEKRVDALLKQQDKNRSNYYHFYAGQQWDDRGEYHMMLDSGTLGIEGCAQLIAAAARGESPA
nr:cytidylate kinase-like family protein [bacterium]